MVTITIHTHTRAMYAHDLEVVDLLGDALERLDAHKVLAFNVLQPFASDHKPSVT